MSFANSLRALSILVVTLIVVACGGGGGGSSSGPIGAAGGYSLSGVAAIGAPIANGDVKIACLGGSGLVQTKTDSAGFWQIAISEQNLPCGLQVSGGTISGAENTGVYHSIAISTGTANITPLTDLMVANLVANPSLGSWFSGLIANGSSLSSISQTSIDTALANLNAAFPMLPLYGSGNHPVVSVFVPSPGNSHDDMLSALKAAMNNISVTHATLLVNASSNFSQLPTGMMSALTAAYKVTSSGSKVVYFPVEAVITAFNADANKIRMSGSVNGVTVDYSESTTVQGEQTFAGKTAKVVSTTGFISGNGTTTAIPSSTVYLRTAPFMILGSVSADSYTLYANQIPLPTMAVVGSSGRLDTGIDYADATKAQLMDTFAESWSLQAGSTSDTASLCIHTSTTAVDPTAASFSSNYCLSIDINGNILQVQATAPIDNVNVTLTSTSLVLSPFSVVSTTPSNGATSVGLTDRIVVAFNKPVASATINTSTFVLTDGITPIDGTVTVSGSNVSFTPVKPLLPATRYSAVITTGVKDLSGMAIDGNYGWVFQTKVTPTVISTSPVSYAYSVPFNSVISVVFSDSMDPMTVKASSFTLVGGATPISGTVSYSGKTASFLPAVPLASNTVYRATVTSEAKDIFGTPLSASYSWAFQTFDPGSTSQPFNPAPAGLWQPATGSTPASGNFVYLESDSGDFIGQGRTHIYTPSNTTKFNVGANGGHFGISIDYYENYLDYWWGDFQGPNNQNQIQPGYYSGLLRYPFHNQAAGGLSWSGAGRGCNMLVGWFVVDYVSYVNGVLTGIDIRFEQQCESSPKALHGAIRWRQ